MATQSALPVVHSKTRAVRKALRRNHGAVGDDGLTDAQRRAAAQRWQESGGRRPSAEEMLSLLALVSSRPEHGRLTLPG